VAAPRRRRTNYRPARRRTSSKDGGPLIVIGVVLIIALSILRVLAAHPAVFALVGVAAIGIAAAVITTRVRRRRAQLEIDTARSYQVAPYHHMNPREFEHALAFLCSRDGCRDVRVVGGAGDLGADVIATVPDGRRIVIQAKRYAPTNTVGSREVQTVNGTYRDAHHAHLAAIVTTSRFTKPALDFARQVGIRTFDANALAGWVSRTGPAPWH
jgi:restriction system protein